MHDDLQRARDIYGDVPVIAVNGASREMKAVALVSQHPERFMENGWIRNQQRLFGDGFSVNAPLPAQDMPWVDRWWDVTLGGGSAWVARKIASLMGYGLVVLCGAPLVPGNYTGHRPGQLMSRENIVADLRAGIERDTAWHAGCVSMSGWTRELLC